jgi:tRNA threonylcarbamoyladenosine biosynthesis protein TsaE
MNSSQFSICSLDEWGELIAHLTKQINEGRTILLLNGELGSGKTALVKAFVQYSIAEEADSPTFALVNTYGSGTKRIHHFDLYRLQSAQEVEDIGLWDYLDEGVPCFIEWPDKIAELLPEERCVHIQIELLSNLCRNYTVSSY